MNNKHAFWQALILTIIVFAIGIMVGVIFEGQRASNLKGVLENSEVGLLDEQMRVEAVKNLGIGCDVSLNNTFDFADRIYNEALALENDDAATKFTDELKVIHRRYDLLRTLLWMQSVELKNNCSEEFHTLVYLYSYNSQDSNTDALQISFSRVLKDLKDKYPDKVLLIPIAADMNLSSVDLVLKERGITKLPVVIVDEKKMISDLVDFGDLERTVFSKN